MVAHVGVHDDDEVAPCEFQPVNVRGPQAEFARAGFEHDALGRVERLQLLRDGEGPVGGGIVYDDEFPVEVAGGVVSTMGMEVKGRGGKEEGV